MGKIDINNWSEYEIGKLFDIKRPASRSQLDYDEGDVPFVASGNYNNGVVGYYEPKKDEVLDKGNCITVSPLDGSAFYQKEDFLGRGGAGSAIILLYNENLNEKRGLFISTAIRYQLTKYSYNDQLSSKVIVKEKIHLPSGEDGEPAWNYMERYIEQLESVVDKSITTFKLAKNSDKHRMNTPAWKDFHLYDNELFDVDSGTKLDKVKMDTSIEEVAFVGRSNVNNGITARVKKIGALEPYSKGYLTLALGGEYLGSCFVQPEDFYTSQNVVVLIPKWNMSFYVKQFIATAIFVESQNNYQAFIKELNAHVKRDFVIKLPVTEMGEPDWNYMESIMRKIDNRVKETVNNLICG